MKKELITFFMFLILIRFSFAELPSPPAVPFFNEEIILSGEATKEIVIVINESNIPKQKVIEELNITPVIQAKDILPEEVIPESITLKQEALIEVPLATTLNNRGVPMWVWFLAFSAFITPIILLIVGHQHKKAKESREKFQRVSLLKQYVQYNLSHGYPRDQMKFFLLQKGYDIKEVEEAINGT